MDFKKFEKLKLNYKKFITEAEEAINKETAKDQTRSVWFDRETIEKLLAQTDPKSGGIKVFMGMYDKDTLSEREDQDRAEAYIGKLTLVLAASDDNQDPDQETMIVNGGKVCPPDC
ncbi:hypothetical protein [Cyclobacterium sp.]|uniref:hypothetical protein n=1 Tax=Cyclobacterium sp. TaxID=1966343 RepID=UPI0019965268|nr:hypothetical protein [Cyclobacterium sp.]MBD3630562.1 hypothetical protein [Cyclobacterium sp.]